jgi:hypothetical protein
MDGIDGIAALQPYLQGVGLGSPGVFSKARFDFSVIWNRRGLVGLDFSSTTGSQPDLYGRCRKRVPRIYSGSAASRCAVRSTNRDPDSPIVAVLFVWFFVFDTVFTLIKRLIGRRRVWEAHREHIYQKLVIEGWPHAPVALVYNSAGRRSDRSGSALRYSFRNLSGFDLFIPNVPDAACRLRGRQKKDVDLSN